MPPAPRPRSPAAKRRPSFASIVTVISDKGRWRILRELVKGKPLPASELSRRTGLTASAASKHLRMLGDLGILERGFGGVYEIAPEFLVPGQNVLDFGVVLMRLDEMP
jgi:DNA-binding transcriptional ArsR family regulator